ncbi:MAG: hypothetical protein KBS62_03445 [Oscillospiraceae bacterium]|nr:hypothetical protein [Candidatus Ruminococcus equi]
MSAPATWGGSLKTNEIFTSIYNMIISQQVYADNIGRTFTSLVDRARVDGTLFGDTYLKYATNALETYAFSPDTSDQLNVLSTNRPADPHVQAITLDVFRQIPITIDNYFSKRAFSTETAFADFNSVCLQWLRDTKRIYDATTYNAYIGTVATAEGSQSQEIDLTGITASATTTDDEAYERLVAERIAEGLSNIITEMKDIGTGYNDLGYYRAYDPSDLVIVWNAEWVHKLRKVGLPTIFNKDGLLEIKDENVLPAKYFGTVNAGTTTSAGDRALREMKISNKHYWAGEVVATGSTVTAKSTYSPTPAVDEDGSIICKIMHKNSVPYMSGFETETTFINGKNLSENHYLTFGHNTLQYLYNCPMVTVTAGLS